MDMRARNIKPGFFRNEDLVEISPSGRLLFIGLWCMADRKGLLEDRPKKIKLELMPYDDINCDTLLQELNNHKLILRYNVNGNKYIAIPNFTKHQRPHPNEKLSELPPPIKTDKLNKTFNHGDTSGEPRTAPLGTDTLNADTLNADILNADVLNPDTHSKGGKKIPPACPQKMIVELYHEVLPEMPQVRIWNDDQRSWLRARWCEYRERQDLAWWGKFFTWIRESDFLMGRTDSDFQPDLEWLIRKRNFAKIANGRYHKKKKNKYSGIDEWLAIRKKRREKDEGKG